jgi:hypothetical protein
MKIFKLFFSRQAGLFQYYFLVVSVVTVVVVSVITVVVSGAAGVTIVAVSLVTVVVSELLEVSELLLQAVTVAAIAKTKNNFFMCCEIFKLNI